MKLGSLPDEWESTTLGRLCGRITTGKLDANAMVADGEYPFFTCARENYWIDKYAFDSEALLVSGNGANVGYVHYYRGKFNAYQRTYVINEFSADVQFLRLFLERNLRERIRVEVNAGNTPYITMGTLTEMEVVLPCTRDEQRAIAEALSDVDALLGALDRLIAKKRDLKQAAMQQLLTGQTRLPGFHGEWGVSTVGREFEVKLGKMLDAEKNVGVPKPFLGNKAVQWDRIDISNLPTVPMSRADLERFRLKKGDLLVCEGGEVGRAAIWEAPIEECYYQKALHRLRPLRGFNPQFMAALLRLWSDRGLLSNYVTQTSIAHLPREKLMEVPMPLPPHPEQTAIAEALTEMDAELTGLEQRREETRILKQSMMQELLSGRTRLI